MDRVQCRTCGRMVEYLVDDGICPDCFSQNSDEEDE